MAIPIDFEQTQILPLDQQLLMEGKKKYCLSAAPLVRSSSFILFLCLFFFRQFRGLLIFFCSPHLPLLSAAISISVILLTLSRIVLYGYLVVVEVNKFYCQLFGKAQIKKALLMENMPPATQKLTKNIELKIYGKCLGLM